MQFLVYPYFPKGQIHMLAGRSGSGKTFLTFQTLHSLIKRGVLAPADIAYFAADRDLDTYAHLFDTLKIPEEQRWTVRSELSETFRLQRDLMCIEDEKVSFTWMHRTIVTMVPRPSLVILDPAQTFIPCKNANHHVSAAGGLKFIVKWAKELAVTVLLVWHPNKVHESQLNDPFDRIAGAHTLQGYTSTKAFLDAPSAKAAAARKVPLHHLYLRGQHFPDMDVPLLREEDGTFCRAFIDETPADLIDCFHEGQPLPIEEVLAFAKTLGIKRSTAFSRLAALRENGLVTSPEKGVYLLPKQTGH